MCPRFNEFLYHGTYATYGLFSALGTRLNWHWTELKKFATLLPIQMESPSKMLFPNHKHFVDKFVLLTAWKASRIREAQVKSLLSCISFQVITSCPSLSLNNYWMRLSMISWIIKTEVCVICRSRRLRQITQTRGFDNSRYHAKTKFNNCFIIHFSHNSSSETEAKRSAILFLRRTLQGA